MEHQPEDILSLLGTYLTLKNILALASTSKELERKLLSPEFNKSVATHFGFPFGLSLTELKAYESMSLNDRLIDASRTGDMRVVDRLIELGASDYHSAMISAAQKGHKKVVERMLRLGVNSYTLRIDSGHGEKIIVRVPQSNADNYNQVMDSAAEGGHMEIVEKMLELGANYYNGAMVFAAQKGHKEIVERMLRLGADNYNQAMTFAAQSGHSEIVELIRSYS
jgi:ankyrin repeat protein